MRNAILVSLVGVLSSAAAAPIVDGTLDAEYGAPIVVQTVNTQFGDASPPGSLSGSELDAAYARVDGDRLYLIFTGNLEPNFNKLSVFIDSKVGGENVLSGLPAYDVGNLSTNLGGMTFDAGFEADYHMFSRWGGGAYEVDFVDRQGGLSVQVPGSTGMGSGAVGNIDTGSIAPGAAGIAPNASGPALTQALDFALNDNNSAGVTGGDGPADQVAAAAVTTGMEFSIALADIGDPGSGEVIRISAMIGNGDHNYLSNQILGGLPAPQGNLGGDGAGNFTGNLAGIDLNQFAGDQYFEVTIPEPASLGLVVFAGLLVFRRR